MSSSVEILNNGTGKRLRPYNLSMPFLRAVLPLCLAAVLWPGALAASGNAARSATKLLDLEPTAPYWIARVPDGGGFRIASWFRLGDDRRSRFFEVRFDPAAQPSSDPTPLVWRERWTAPYDGSYALLSRDVALHAWAEPAPDGSSQSLLARVTPDGGTPSGVLHLDHHAAEWITDPVLAPCPDGRFAAVWKTRTTRTEGSRVSTRWDIVARAFGPDGTPLGPECSLGRVLLPEPLAVACGPDGSWLVAWTALRSSDATPPLSLRVLDRHGRLPGEVVRLFPEPEVRRGEMLPARAHRPVAVGDFRGWVVGFERQAVHRGESFVEELLAVAVGPDGQPMGAPFPLGGETVEGSSPHRLALALGEGGGLFATWECRRRVDGPVRLCGRSFVVGVEGAGGWTPTAPPAPLTAGPPGAWHGVLATTDGFVVHWTGSERSPRAESGSRAVWGRLLPPVASPTPAPPAAPAGRPETRPDEPSPAG